MPVLPARKVSTVLLGREEEDDGDATRGIVYVLERWTRRNHNLRRIGNCGGGRESASLRKTEPAGGHDNHYTGPWCAERWAGWSQLQR